LTTAEKLATTQQLTTAQQLTETEDLTEALELATTHEMLETFEPNSSPDEPMTVDEVTPHSFTEETSNRNSGLLPRAFSKSFPIFLMLMIQYIRLR